MIIIIFGNDGKSKVKENFQLIAAFSLNQGKNMELKNNLINFGRHLN
jgi:hypothetical protein